MSDSDYLMLGSTGAPSPPAGPLGRLAISGVNFLDAGKPWKYRAVTAFTLLQDGFTGINMPFLQWAVGIGANTVRVFGMWSVTGFAPWLVEGYYSGFDQLCARLAATGLRLHFVAFTDQVPPLPGNTDIRMSDDQQNTHLRRIVEIAREYPNVLLEICNEDWKNGGIAGRFPREWFDGVLTTRSSWEDGKTPLEAGSVLDWTTEHTPRGSQWERKAKNLLETSRQGLGDFPATGKPAIAGEPERLQNATPRQYADYVAVAELFASGACLHGDGDTLQRCRIPADDSVARAVAAVWADPPPADLAAIGEYSRGQKDGQGTCPLVHRDRYDDDGNEVEPSGSLRTFAMLAGNRATAVVVSPGPGWRLEPRNGWRVVRSYGYAGNTIDLEQ